MWINYHLKYIKKKLLIVLLVVQPYCYVKGQEVSSDSLYSLFKNGNVFKVIESVDIKYTYPDSIYNNIKLRPYWIKLLDKYEYRNFLLENRMKGRNREYFDWYICNILRKEGIKNTDSIIFSTTLHDKYLAKAKKNISNLDSIQIKSKISKKAVDIFSIYLMYPEGYIIIKKEWTASGRKKDYLYRALLRYNDPEALSILNDEIKTSIKNNEIPNLYWNTQYWENNSNALELILSSIGINSGIDYFNRITAHYPFDKDRFSPYSEWLLCDLYRLSGCKKCINSGKFDFVKYNLCVAKNKIDIIELIKLRILELRRKENIWMKEVQYIKSQDLND